MKRIAILGSTGSIGESALRVVEALPEAVSVVAIGVRSDVTRALTQAAQFGIGHVAVVDEAAAKAAAAQAPAGVQIHVGEGGLEEIASLSDVDLVLCSVVGIAGLRPVMAAIDAGKDIALATKEVLVAAGSLVMRAAAEKGVQILPVDSEHSAIFQCLQGEGNAVRRLILTASGGPFADRPELDLDRVTVDDALDHPRWDMGRKVTIDSATLMNKGLEIMEARWLFTMAMDAIDVVIHPESIVHSLVELVDGNVLAQLGVPDMRFAIQYALLHPERRDGGLPRLDLAAIKTLHFREPDMNRFPCLGLARRAAAEEGTLPAVLNAANEVAVEKFLVGKRSFSAIWRTVESVMDRHKGVRDPSLDDVFAADQWARKMAGEC